MDYKNKPEATFNKISKLWEVRLAELVVESTKFEAERRACRLLAAYHEASNLVSSPIQISQKAQVAELNSYIDRVKELEKANAYLKHRVESLDTDYRAGQGALFND